MGEVSREALIRATPLTASFAPTIYTALTIQPYVSNTTTFNQALSLRLS
jgi:hypothetical protein